MTFPAFLDTCTLFGALQCDVILSIAEQGVFAPYWSRRVLDAIVRNVVDQGRATEVLARGRTTQMERAFPEAMVDGFENLIPAMTNHPGDRHVLAACILSPAQTLVTANLKDFPAAALEPYGITAVHPDAFLLDQLDLHPRETLQGLSLLLERHQRPPQDLSQLSAALANSDVPLFARRLAEWS